jgi:hypothetical protein
MRSKMACLVYAGFVALLLTGCAAPSPVGVFAVDALTGAPVKDVRVERFDKKTGIQPVGSTDESGRLEGIAVKLGNRLTLEREGYEARGLEIGFSDAKPLKLIPHSESQKFPAGQYAPDTADEAIPYPPDRMMVVPMHPKRD